MKKYLLVLTCCLPSILFSQEIMVVDQTDLNPIEHAIISVKGKKDQFITGKTGIAFLNGVAPADTLILKHTSYYTRSLTLEDLALDDYTVKMAERSIRLEEVVISANKWEQNRAEVPTKIVIISPKDILFDNPQNTADLLGQTGQVFVQKSQQGGGSPMIRGFSANSLLIVVDGVRMNNAIYRSGNLHNVNSVDPYAIDNAEVIFGPGSVIYGSDALGGVMDFHTKSPVLSTNEGLYTSAGWLARYSSANNERTVHLDVNVGTGKWGFLTSISGFFFDNLRMGSVKNSDYRKGRYAARIDSTDVMVDNPNPDVQLYTLYNQLNLMQKVRFSPSEDLDLEYGFHYATTTDMPRYDRLIQYKDDGTQSNAQWYYGPQNWMMHNLTLRLRRPVKPYTDARIIVAYQDYEESRHSRKFGKDNRLEQFEHARALTLNGDFEKDITVNDFLFYGLEVAYNDVDSRADEFNIATGKSTAAGPRYPDGINHYSTLAGYASYKRNFKEKFTLLAGARYTYVDLYSTIADTSFYHFPFDKITLRNHALSGSLGFTFHPGNNFQFNADLSSGFRAPNLDDVGKVFDSEPGNVVVPNPDLKPEYSYNLEVGLLKSFGETARIELDLFGTILDQAMVRGDFSLNGMDSIYYRGELSKVQAVINADGAYIYGGSLMLELALSGTFSFRTDVNYVYGEDNEGNSIRHAPPVYGGAYLVMKREKFRGELFALYNGQVPYRRLAPSERSKDYLYAIDSEGNPYSPAWWTLNLKTSYQISHYLSVDLGMENILDVRYRPYSSGVVSPGRNIYLTLRGRI